MATTWTCASGHTHDVSKPGWQHPYGVAAGLDTECKGCGDRITDTTPTASDVGRNASAAPHKQFVASSRTVTSI